MQVFSLRDKLTGLLTREGFLSKLIAAQDSSRQRGLAVVWFNLDNFKMFNKRFGFERGDNILKEIAGLLTKIFRGELIARFSDDNFIVLTEWTSVEINIESLQEYLYSSHENIALRLRAGIYFPSEGDDIRLSCDRAKLACDSIRKNHSLNSCMFHEGMSRELALQQHILDNLDSAISKNYIRVLYQPIIKISSGKICEIEALARWLDPERGFISPGEFINTLEQYMEIHKLDIHAFNQVCRDYESRIKKNLPLIPVSINLSRLDFELCDIYSELEDALELCRIPPELIRIEITESKFRAKGHEVWMDDFGSGYSSLNVLKDYNFDTIKFDMKFLHGFDINKSEKAKYIISSNLQMARLMGMQALAEGVETLEQLEYLRSIGFDKAQGYYFGKPMNLDEIFSLERGIEYSS